MYYNDINEILRIAGVKLNESIAYASKKDLSDVVLLNPTKRELKENNMINSRCMVDSDGCWYFCDMQNMLHSNMESIFREDVFFPYYDGNDCYGIAYYDLENNEFWYNDNGDMSKKECENQYKYSDYLRTTFPNAKVVPNPYGWNDEYDEDNDEDLNESYGRMDRPFIWNDPTYSQFHRILRDNTTYGKLSAIIDNGHIYCWDSALSHHDSVVKDIEESGIKLSDDYIWVRFKEPNLCWVSAAYFDDYTDEDLEDLPQQDFEKELEDNPIIKKYFPQGVKVVRFDNISESVLNEELIHMEKSSYDEHLASIVKNPTKKELRENHLKRSRFICFADGTWLFFDPMEWIHEQVLNKYALKFGRGKNSGFYDYDKNQFIFIHGMNYDEGEDGYEEEFNHYVNKDRKFLLSYPYIKQTFGTDFNIMVYGDWVDSPW